MQMENHTEEKLNFGGIISCECRSKQLRWQNNSYNGRPKGWPYRYKEGWIKKKNPLQRLLLPQLRGEGAGCPAQAITILSSAFFCDAKSLNIL